MFCMYSMDLKYVTGAAVYTRPPWLQDKNIITKYYPGLGTRKT